MTANHGLHLSFRLVKGVFMGVFLLFLCVCVVAEYVLIILRLDLKLTVNKSMQ